MNNLKRLSLNDLQKLYIQMNSIEKLEEAIRINYKKNDYIRDIEVKLKNAKKSDIE